MTAVDLRLYLVTDPVLAGGRPLEDVVRAAVSGGVTLVQLRDKDADELALREQAMRLRQLLDPLGVPLVINDRIDVALAVGAAGVHVGGSDADPVTAREQLGPEAIVGFSASTRAGLPDVPPGTLTYVAVGPVWLTATKRDAGQAVGTAEIAATVAATALPVVGIGGISVGRAGDVVRAGAAGVSVVSAIVAAPDPAAAARELRADVDAALASRP